MRLQPFVVTVLASLTLVAPSVTPPSSVVRTMPVVGASAHTLTLSTPTVIRGVTVINGTGAAPQADATVVIRAGRIEAVGPSRSLPVPAGAEVIDGRGKYLIPGLINTHAHIACTVCKGASVEWQLNLEMAHGMTGVCFRTRCAPAGWRSP